ncbi:uncharacterized protein O3C94_002137 isoform 1-T1 [Discoglossus pictus]
MAVLASAALVLFHPLTLRVPHAVSVILLQNKVSYLSPSRHLSCMTILLSQPHLHIERCTTLNPSTLVPIPEDGTPHACTEIIKKEVSPRDGLRDVAYTEATLTLFVDGSSSRNKDGTNATGYAVVTQEETIRAGKLPSHFAAQAAEIVALTEACKIGQGQIVNIYTDSQYAFSTVHIFAQLWKNRGMVTSTGRQVTHKQLLLQLLEAIQLPLKIAVCKCVAHTTTKDAISIGNGRADTAAKQAAQTGKIHIFLLHSYTSVYFVNHIDKSILQQLQANAPSQEKTYWLKKGSKLNADNIYESLEGKPILPKSLFRYAAMLSHGISHVSRGSMVDMVSRIFSAYGLNTYFKIFVQGALFVHNTTLRVTITP